jgi:hypothetical protein
MTGIRWLASCWNVAGETITIDVLRDGETFQTTLTLGERA